MNEKLTVEEAQAIGRAAASNELKPEDVSFMSKPPKQAKQPKPSEPTTAKPEAVSEPTPAVPKAPSDTDLLAKKKDYDKARSQWAHGTLSTQELDTFHATYMRARAVYSSQQSLYGARLPPGDPLPNLSRDLDVAKLDRDECQEKLRTARVEEQKLKQEKASSPDVKIAAISGLALDILHDINDSRSIPALSVKAALADDLVKTLENQMRVARRGN
jgi:hypothetical protein